MQYDPKAICPPAEAGKFNYIVVDAKEKVSKAGNPYISLKLSVNIEGYQQPRHAYAKLLTHPAMLFIMRHFCESNGLEFNGNLSASDCLGLEGVADFEVDDRGFMVVKDFVVSVESEKQNDSGIPF